jgi:exodeoxyribonuclease V alpha subunit
MTDASKSAATDILEGRVRRVRYSSDDSKFQVLVVRDDAQVDHTVVARNATVSVGEALRLRGRWGHRGLEVQFEAASVERVMPTTAAGVASWLGSGVIPGVGPALAEQIVAKFGEETFDVLDTAPERLREVPGIGAQRARTIREKWSKASASREQDVWLRSIGLSPAMTRRIVARYGDGTVPVLRDDPYRLAREVKGIGFRLADRIARGLGFAVEDPRRLAGALFHALDEAESEGHVYLPRNALIEAAASAAEVPSTHFEPVLDAQIDARRLVADPAGAAPDSAIYARARFVAEDELARRVFERASVSMQVPEPVEVDLAISRLGLAAGDEQRAALSLVYSRALAVLTGGPGTGKTTIVRAIVYLADRAALRVLTAAPTGRAARRLSDATGREAKTVHRLLEVDPRRGEFVRNAGNPLEADLVIVDEASMLDLDLALALLRAIGKQTRLLLVGDADQLPSVGPGDVLRDLIASGVVPVARLTRIYRQAAQSGIVRCAHEIGAGHYPEPAERPDGDWFFVDADDPERAVALLERVVVERLPRAFGLDPREDIQVLVPMNSGALGTIALNTALQRAHGLGGDAVEVGTRRFHLGDRVMQTRNNYELDVFNGDIGRVVALDAAGRRADVDYDGRRVVYGSDELEELDLAWAISVHKSQGSEFRAVVLVISTHHYRLLQRNLVYTAVTRARERLVVVGARRAWRMAIDDVSAVRRFTRLAARLCSAAAPATR